jgi:hypothetical protein
MRDWSKCGLRFPRYLLKIAQEELVRRFPFINDKIINIYENIELTVDNFVQVTSSGYILGMANCLVTFLSIAFYRMILSEFEEDVELMVGNDDMIIATEYPKTANKI